MKKLFTVLCVLNLSGCALAWDGGYQVIPEETDNETITFKFDPAIADMKKMKRDANSYCREHGFRKADTAAVQGNFFTLSQMVYECEP
ncbi:hypothetical protein DBN05_000571 [Salmonella enterica subsp. enterica serovar Anderlecht]|nr:hypothetical protein [Salmonella enterica subsp. enterica serovar Coquilhatville]EDU0974135.1 hypothetical protein [Salmonella enterica subsp. enterica serovar Anderlecht]EEJ3528469.1 hypothetical protein [Salmonella enterica subsp. enterica serovar Anderlecht]MIX06583.1 hypothetical protein [Salmonella enterica subsp. enterica serovar Anderlecht]